MNDSDLSAAAFGDDPGRWPLPPALSSEQLWLRAVAAAGQGRYSSARADLTALHRQRPTDRLNSLAQSTHASFLRQLGWHKLARSWDGRALAMVATNDDAKMAEAKADAITGLAADALGIGRLAASAALLSKAIDIVAAAGPDTNPRIRIRLAWVSAELAMAGGDGGSALSHAKRGVELVGQMSPAMLRHHVKSNVVLAAALCCAGNLDSARAVADAALAETLQYRLVPLQWALTSLLAGIGSKAHSPLVVAEIHARSAEFVTRHGGRWSGC